MSLAVERRGSRGAAGETLLVLLVWGATIALIRPVGNFPLHDDWDFATATFNFARSGEFRFTEFTVVSLRAMVLWGAAWVRLLGESFDVLRASTLTLSAATVLLLHHFLREAGIERWMRLLSTFSLLFHPIFLWASCTYMTEIPFVFVSLLSLYFFHRGFTRDRLWLVAAACALVVVSWFVRQTGVATAAAALAVLLIGRRRISERWRLHATLPLTTLLLFAALFLWKREWLSAAPRMFEIHYQMWGESSFRLPEKIGLVYHYVVFNALNSAIFFLPLAVLLVSSLWQKLTRRELAGLAAVAALVFWRVMTLAAAGYLFPYSSDRLFSDILPGPVVYDFGIGPLNLYDTFTLHKPYVFTLWHPARLLLTFAAGCAASILLWALMREAIGWIRVKKNVSVLFALGVAAVIFGTAALLGSGFYYDRYALDSAWAVALAVPAAVAAGRRRWRTSATAALVLLALFSTLAVQEYFAWNRARWEAFDSLRSRGVALQEIDGGTEAKAFYELAKEGRRAALRPSPPRRFVVAFRSLEGYTVVERRPFSGFFGLRRGEIVTLRRR